MFSKLLSVIILSFGTFVAAVGISSASDALGSIDEEVRAQWYNQECPETLDKTKVLDDITTMYYSLVPSSHAVINNGVLCVRLEAEGEQWMGFAVSKNGKMIGAEAIIGTPEDGLVQKYNLVKDGLFRTVELNENEEAQNSIRNPAIIQENGMTKFEFTKLLVEDGEIPILEEGSNRFLYARGFDNQLSYHESKTSFTIDFSNDSAEGAVA